MRKAFLLFSVLFLLFLSGSVFAEQPCWEDCDQAGCEDDIECIVSTVKLGPWEDQFASFWNTRILFEGELNVKPMELGDENFIYLNQLLQCEFRIGLGGVGPSSFWLENESGTKFDPLENTPFCNAGFCWYVFSKTEVEDIFETFPSDDRKIKCVVEVGDKKGESGWVTILEQTIRDSEKYEEFQGQSLGDKPVFLVSDVRWQTVLEAVPLAIWYPFGDEWEEFNIIEDPERGMERGNAAYPLLIYHREGIKFDAESVLLFLEQYQPTSVVGIVGNYKEEPALGVSEFDKERLIMGMIMKKANISGSKLLLINESSIPSFWKEKGHLVVSESPYDTGDPLIASQLASTLSIPFVAVKDGKEKDLDGFLIPKTGQKYIPKMIVLVGSPPYSATMTKIIENNFVLSYSPEDYMLLYSETEPVQTLKEDAQAGLEILRFKGIGGTQGTFSRADLQKYLISITNADKIVLVNPRDLGEDTTGKQFADFTYYPGKYYEDDEPFEGLSKLFYKDSLTAPYYAAAKSGIIFPVSSEAFSLTKSEGEISKVYGTTDQGIIYFRHFEMLPLSVRKFSIGRIDKQNNKTIIPYPEEFAWATSVFGEKFYLLFVDPIGNPRVEDYTDLVGGEIIPLTFNGSPMQLNYNELAVDETGFILSGVKKFDQSIGFVIKFDLQGNEVWKKEFDMTGKKRFGKLFIGKENKVFVYISRWRSNAPAEGELTVLDKFGNELYREPLTSGENWSNHAAVSGQNNYVVTREDNVYEVIIDDPLAVEETGKLVKYKYEADGMRIPLFEQDIAQIDYGPGDIQSITSTKDGLVIQTAYQLVRFTPGIGVQQRFILHPRMPRPYIMCGRRFEDKSQNKSPENIIENNANQIKTTLDNALQQVFGTYLVDEAEWFITIASPRAIPISKLIGCSHSEIDEDVRIPFDSRLYADLDNDEKEDFAVGRIFGATISDTSSYIARAVFFKEMFSQNKKVLGLGTDHSIARASVSKMASKLNGTGFTFSCYTDKLYREPFSFKVWCETITKNTPNTKVLVDKELIFFGGLDPRFSGSFPQLKKMPIAIAHTAREINFGGQLTPGNMLIRKGSIGFYGPVGLTGAVITSIHKNTGYAFTKEIFLGMQAGNAYRSESERLNPLGAIWKAIVGEHAYANGYHFLYLGDPTIKFWDEPVDISTGW